MTIESHIVQAGQRFIGVHESSCQTREVSYSGAWTERNIMTIHSEQNTGTTQTGGRDDGGLRAATSGILQLIAKTAAHVANTLGARS